ncbi:MAG: hydrogenase maturation protease [Acidobacteriia bacterium]|nr:hydrogenase maturation protease [Terriglobia bacterium]
MPHLLIIGYGNPLLGDDAAGYQAAERLRLTLTGPDVEILAVHQLTPELADPISRAARVIFIDAAATGDPGAIQQRPIDSSQDPGGFTHHATPSALLALAKALYGADPRAVLITVAGLDFGIGMELSAPVQQALDRLVWLRVPELIANPDAAEWQA